MAVTRACSWQRGVIADEWNLWRFLSRVNLGVASGRIVGNSRANRSCPRALSAAYSHTNSNLLPAHKVHTSRWCLSAYEWPQHETLNSEHTHRYPCAHSWKLVFNAFHILASLFLIIQHSTRESQRSLYLVTWDYTQTEMPTSCFLFIRYQSCSQWVKARCLVYQYWTQLFIWFQSLFPTVPYAYAVVVCWSLCMRAWLCTTHFKALLRLFLRGPSRDIHQLFWVGSLYSVYNAMKIL